MIRAGALAVLCGVVLTIAPAVGQNAAPAYIEPANLRDLVAAVAKEGTLTLTIGRSLGGIEGAQQVQEHMRERYHLPNFTIQYTPVTSGGGEDGRLIQEVKAGQAASSDIMLTGYDETSVPYTQPVDWRKYASDLPPSEILYGHSIKVTSSVSSFVYNTKLVPPNQVPTSFADLLKPQWKGKIATASYDGEFLNFLGLSNILGYPAMMDYVHKFVGQLGGIITCNDQDRVVTGEFLIFGLDCGDHEMRLRQRKGEPVASFYPKEGVPLVYIAPAIPKTAVHPAAARLFLAFLTTREGQDVLWQTAGYDCDILPGSHTGALIADLRKHGVKIVEGPNGQNLTTQYPQLIDYTRQINQLINTNK